MKIIEEIKIKKSLAGLHSSLYIVEEKFSELEDWEIDGSILHEKLNMNIHTAYEWERVAGKKTWMGGCSHIEIRLEGLLYLVGSSVGGRRWRNLLTKNILGRLKI